MTVQLYLGDCLDFMRTLPDGAVDAVVTDPPYSSGGQFRGDRMQNTIAKYVQSSSVDTWFSPFTGDNRDQRAFLVWCSMWMGQARRICKPGGVLLCFIDWRQLPTVTDALQCGGWVWRGIATWWKPGIRMQRGRFSLSAEYLVIGSNGDLAEGERSPQNVFAMTPVNGSDKEHIAEKPVEVLDWALGVTVANSTVFDPFMGSGTTGVACVRTGRNFIGCEIDETYFKIAQRRIAEAQMQPPLIPHEPQPKAEQVELFT